MDEKHILILSDFVGCGNVAMATSRGVLTRLGHRVYCLPTALISNTWNLGAAAQLDTTEYLRRSLEAWQQLGIRLDAVLLGYLADSEQAAFLYQQCEKWRKSGMTIFFDPIFADNGKLYKGITPERLGFLRELLRQVDYVLPNFSEAQFLTGEPSAEGALRGLKELGARHPVITGVPGETGQAVLLCDREAVQALTYDPVPGSFSGAGDAFSSLFAGGILSGLSPVESARNAIGTTKQWIQKSLQESWNGVGLPVERYF